MDLQMALDLKNLVSDQFLTGKQKKSKRHTLAFSADTPAAAGRVATRLPDVINGVGVGKTAAGDHFLKLLTREVPPVERSYLATYYGVPPENLIVDTVGPIRFKGDTRRRRPIYPGCSVGHYKITAGTLGCLVRDAQDRKYILSNNHVLANTNAAFFGDPILQPSPDDSGMPSRDRVARLDSLVELSGGNNEMDAAIALVDEDIRMHTKVNKTQPITGTKAPALRMRVEKWGRTTGHTIGSITTISLDFDVEYDEETFSFIDQVEIKGSIAGGRRTMFCDGGDSGSLILERGTGKAVALLFAGTDDGTTFATPINEVLSAFSVDIF